MKWIEILRKGNIALLQNEGDTQFVLALNYDPTQPEDNQWSHGKYFEYWTPERKPRRLYDAVDAFRSRTEENYISHYRIEELATKFKDKMVELALDCNVSNADFEYELEEFDLEDYEREFFGLGRLREDDDEW